MLKLRRLKIPLSFFPVIFLFFLQFLGSINGYIHQESIKMGYYDFDDHFWSPREVCAQAPAKEAQEPFVRVPKLVIIIFQAIFCRRNDV
jgi:hypothetical protein